ncbi:unnamed protein product [Soboliphyme baturini]|uniref:ZP domain-containing protein n=1 Tax=Soboliphyme baturini TaxID=241478 RepID=A0A183IEP7_9BILA|nr:unnamed protein product [Soboliphyme baturini]
MVVTTIFLGICILHLSVYCNASKSRGAGDFVDSVTCHAKGINIVLKSKLPLPRNGMWKLEVEGYPYCPGATKQDVGGGYAFTLLFADKDLCGTEPKSWFVSVSSLFRTAPYLLTLHLQTPSWVSLAEVTLLLKDSNESIIADSISCLYNTRFGTSLLTFKGEIMSCFNEKNSVVRTILPKMDRNQEGTVYEMPFSAFYFTNYSKNLFVHCTLLACVGEQNLCDPQANCFGTSRRKRRNIVETEGHFSERFGDHESVDGAKSFVITKYVVIEDGHRGLTPDASSDSKALEKLFANGTVCLHPAHFASLLSSLVACIVVLLIIVSCMAGKLARKHKFWCRYEDSLHYAMLNTCCPTPAYQASPAAVTTKF